MHHSTFQLFKMKILLILSLATLACSAKLYINRPVNTLDLLRSQTLADDFRDIRDLIPQRQLHDLIRRYFTKDAQFHRIIMYFANPEVFKAGRLVGNQPEIREFYLWIKEKLYAGSLNSFVSDETNLEEFGNLLNLKPNTEKSSLNGWKGFMKQFLTIYPRNDIRNLINHKVAANGVFAEFWRKLTALRPVYERVFKIDEVRRVFNKFRELGVDTKQLDQMIREDFGWRAEGGSSSGEGNKVLENF